MTALRRFACAAALAIGFALASSAIAQGPAFGRTIAGIAVGEDRIDKARALYGPGASARNGGVESLCYYIEPDRAYLSVAAEERDGRVRGVVLTTFTDVIPGCRDARVGRHLVALRGVGLGDPAARVLAALGKPAETGKLPIPGRDISYADYPFPGGRASCQFEGGRLILIGIELE